MPYRDELVAARLRADEAEARAAAAERSLASIEKNCMEGLICCTEKPQERIPSLVEVLIPIIAWGILAPLFCIGLPLLCLHWGNQ